MSVTLLQEQLLAKDREIQLMRTKFSILEKAVDETITKLFNEKDQEIANLKAEVEHLRQMNRKDVEEIVALKKQLAWQPKAATMDIKSWWASPSKGRGDGSAGPSASSSPLRAGARGLGVTTPPRPQAKTGAKGDGGADTAAAAPLSSVAPPPRPVTFTPPRNGAASVPGPASDPDAALA